MQHSIPHDLPIDLARRATRAALDSYRERFASFDPGCDWPDDDHARVWFSARGLRLDGRIAVATDAVLLELDVPFVFRPLRSTALRIIEEEVREWIERARVGELG